MHFTREPMVETVVTPRDGMKLVVRRSDGSQQEEYSVDALEVVSFGHSLFFRSLERPQAFLLPVSDYEVLEVKELRMSLKAALPAERTAIKIGGGRKEPVLEEGRETSASSGNGEEQRKKRRRRGRRGRGGGGAASAVQGAPVSEPAVEGEQKSPSFISKLFPPPPALIRDTLQWQKETQPPVAEVPFEPSEEEGEEL
ncbi:MAG: hypothetical protein KGI80_01770 [Verrucomicrobiota bacterium]|nr:hypothetical protein [Verrucomicrobiota bacterium]